jgi:anti-sigma factor RsiW
MSRTIVTPSCPIDEIAAYIDGELDALREADVQIHFADCDACSLELTKQKQFLCGLTSSLKKEGEINLPADFTKRIIANAESNVSGLRPPIERYNAVFICAALFLFVLFALGAEAGRIFEGVATVLDQVGAVGGIFGRVVYSVFLGLAIILRSFASQLNGSSIASVLIPSVFAVFLMSVSRRFLRARHV